MAEEQKTDALATREQQALANKQLMNEIAGDLVTDAGKGTENAGEVRPPRILVCQSGSPYRKPGNAKQIPGLEEMDIFNDLSGDNYKKGPLKIVVVNILPVRHIEFAPMEQGGGVIDFDVKPGDPRTMFTTDAEGKRQKPIATTFMEFLVWLPDQEDVAVLSMKGSQLSVAERLKGKTKLPIKGELIDPRLKGQIVTNPPSWARTFSLTTAMASKDNYSWAAYNLKDEGLTPAFVREICRGLNETYSKKNIVIDREAEEAEFGFGANAPAGVGATREVQGEVEM